MCYLLHLLHDLVLPLVFGDGADEEAAVVQAHAHSDELPRTDLVVVQHLDRSLSRLPGPQPITHLIDHTPHQSEGMSHFIDSILQIHVILDCSSGKYIYLNTAHTYIQL